MPAIIPIAIGAAAIGSAAVISHGAQKAANTQAQAQQEAIAAQERASEAERQARVAATAKEEAVRQEAIKREETTRQEAIKRKEEAIKNIKYPTYLETATAPLLRQTLEERLAGKGLTTPVSPLDIDKLTAPFAAQRRAGLKNEEASISAAASARGLGRSTIPVGQIGLSSQAAERDIEQRVADLQIQNKKIEEANIERERQQKADALSGYERFTGMESATQREKAQFEQGGEFDIADTITRKAEAKGATEAAGAGAIGEAERQSAVVYKQDQFSIADSMEQKGATKAASELQQTNIWASALIGINKSAERSSEDIINAINQEQRNRAMVNISGKTQNVSVAPPNYYLRRG